MRLEDALAGGYPVRAVILGSAVNNDGSQKPGYTAPTVDGQVEVVSQALAVAGVEADDIAFIEAHGTGTVLGDAIEIGALTKVMRRATEAVGLCTWDRSSPTSAIRSRQRASPASSRRC